MIICGHCKNRYHEIATVKLCHAGEVFPCDWLVKRVSFDDQTGERHVFIENCGAGAWVDDRAFQCEAGHEHVNLGVRLSEGWDYASDEDEAAGRARYGYDSRF